MTRILSSAVALVMAAALGLAALPSTGSAQKALVYCPPSDTTGCDYIVSALSASGGPFPSGVDRGYDGGSSTVNLATADLSQYAAIIIPSLADDSTSTPYGLLRSSTVAPRLNAVLGHVAVWSGTPDQGTGNVTAKETLLRHLAAWAAIGNTAPRATGLVVLEDFSDDVTQRYAWLGSVAGLAMGADTTLGSYASVNAVTATGTQILDEGGSVLAYANMATFGLTLPGGSSGIVDAVAGDGGTAVLVTATARATGPTVVTDRPDYPPGDTVVITGTGWKPGETVALLLHEVNTGHADRTFAAIADGVGKIFNNQFSPDSSHIGVTFILTATGKTSGLTAQTTFTDGNLGVSASPTTISPNQPSSAGVSDNTQLTVGSQGSATSNVSVRIRQGTSIGGTLVRTLAVGDIAKGANATVTWDGKDDNGIFVAEGTYTARAFDPSDGETAAPGQAATIVVDNTNPAVAITSISPLTPVPGSSATISGTATDGGSGVASVTLTITVPGGSTLTPTVTNTGSNFSTWSATFTPSASGSYSATAKATDRAANNATSPPFPFSVQSPCTPPSITTQPSSVTATVGQQASFTVVATGSAPLGYQWRKGGTNISGAISATYTIASVAATDAGSYDVVVSGACTPSATSQTATLTVNKIATTLTTAAAIGSFGGTTTLSATLKDASNGAVTGKSISFALNGTAAGTATTDGSGVATLSSASLGAIAAGSYPSGVSASFAGDASFSSSSGTGSLTVSQKPLTASITAADKVYDATTAATITGSTLTGARPGDNVSLAVGSATFDSKSVGTAKTVTATGLSLTGTDAGNYTVNATAATTADITPKGLAVGTVTVANKEYDGNTTATITGRTLASGGVLGTDDVSLSGGTATFNDKNVGTAKAVSITGLGLTGRDAGNYSLNPATASSTADITPRLLTVSATGVSREYNGTTAATVNLSDNRISGDALTLAYASASFADKNVGTNKPVSVSGISISGTDAGNYTANTTASTTADITPRPLVVTATGHDKVYDGTAAATVDLHDDRVSGDVLTAGYGSAAFNNKNVGTSKPVSVSGIAVSGADAGNYTFNTTTSTTAEITALRITGSFTVANKVYDGTTAATIATRNLTGTIGSDDVSLSGGTATFSDKNVGTGKSVTGTGFALAGTDAPNYDLTSVGTTSADITVRGLVVAATGQNKTYDGTTTATVTLSDDRVSGDQLTASYALASFSDKNVGTGKAISVSGIAISGTDAGNYKANTTTTTTADITQRPVTVTADAKSKTYGDADPALTYQITSGSVVDGDAFTGALSRVSGENVGPYAINQGTVALSTNYELSFVPGVLTINQRPITITADPKTKVFGTPDPALTYKLTAGTLVNSDALTGSLTRAPGEDVGTYAILQGSVSAGPNYAITYIGSNLTIQSWTLTGYYQPVDMSAGGLVYNTVKGGSTVPLKFNVYQATSAGTNERTDVGAIKSFTQASVACTTGAAQDPVEVTTTGGTILRYDATGHQFIQNWQTPKAAGACYKVTMTTLDGSTLQAYFMLK